MTIVTKPNNISPLIPAQLPSFLEEEGSKLGAFLQSYYEFLETNQITYTGDNTFEVNEIIKGNKTKARAQVLGYNRSNNTLFLKPLTRIDLTVNESFVSENSSLTGTITKFLKNPIRAAHDYSDLHDVDYTSFEFLDHFRKSYSGSLSFFREINYRNVIKLAKKLFTYRGTEASLRWLWRALFQSDNFEIVYPKNFIFRVSDGRWTRVRTIRLSPYSIDNVELFRNTKITGQSSTATAIVTHYGYNYQDVEIYLQEYEGNFIPGEFVQTEPLADGSFTRGQIVPIVTGFRIIDGGYGYREKDEITFVTETSTQIGKAIVKKVAGGALTNIRILDGGDGYFPNTPISIDNNGTNGTGARAEISSVYPRGYRSISPLIMSDVADVQLNANNFGDGLSGADINTHLASFDYNTFLATVDTSGLFVRGMYIADSGNNVLGTVIEVPNTTTIMYATSTASNFIPNADPQGIALAYYANGTYVSGTTAQVTNITSVFDISKFGALGNTFLPFGPITGINVIQTGRDYTHIPFISITSDVSQDEFIDVPRSLFMHFAEKIDLDDVQIGDVLIGEASATKAVVTTPEVYRYSNSSISVARVFISPTSLALDSTDSLGSDEFGSVLLEDGYKIELQQTDFVDGETLYNSRSNTYWDLAAANSIVVDTVNWGASAKVIGELTASEDVGGGAVVEIQVTDFGPSVYNEDILPSVTLSGGDGSANIVPVLGAISEYDGYYATSDGLISDNQRLFDSYFYQDYSYVIKSDKTTDQYRDSVYDFLHPGGWALFGEFLITDELDLRMNKRFLTVDEDGGLPTIEFGSSSTNYPLFPPLADLRLQNTAPSYHIHIGEDEIQSVPVNAQPSKRDFLSKLQFPIPYIPYDPTITVGPEIDEIFDITPNIIKEILTNVNTSVTTNVLVDIGLSTNAKINSYITEALIEIDRSTSTPISIDTYTFVTLEDVIDPVDVVGDVRLDAFVYTPVILNNAQVNSYITEALIEIDKLAQAEIKSAATYPFVTLEDVIDPVDVVGDVYLDTMVVIKKQHMLPLLKDALSDTHVQMSIYGQSLIQNVDSDTYTIQVEHSQILMITDNRLHRAFDNLPRRTFDIIVEPTPIVQSRTIASHFIDYQPIYNFSYISPNDNYIRTVPTIEEFFWVMNESTANVEQIIAYHRLTPSIASSNPIGVNINDMIAFDDIIITLEDGSVDNILYEDDTSILYEDGYNSTELEYSSNTSYFGAVALEENYLILEEESRANTRVQVYNKYDNKYMVQEVSDSSIKVYNASEKYIPEGSISSLIQNFNIF